MSTRHLRAAILAQVMERHGALGFTVGRVEKGVSSNIVPSHQPAVSQSPLVLGLVLQGDHVIRSDVPTRW